MKNLIEIYKIDRQNDTINTIGFIVDKKERNFVTLSRIIKKQWKKFQSEYPDSDSDFIDYLLEEYPNDWEYYNHGSIHFISVD